MRLREIEILQDLDANDCYLCLPAGFHGGLAESNNFNHQRPELANNSTLTVDVKHQSIPSSQYLARVI
jgi:hypothetical protein